MNRRTFLIKSALGAPVLIGLPLFTSCRKDHSLIATDKKIVIIGAGVSGLAAAKYFKGRGVDVVVLEAQEKIGGRLRTDRSLAVPFDEGASWIHGVSGNPITPIATSAGASTFYTEDDNVAVFDIDGAQYEDGILDSSESDYDDALSDLDGDADSSFGQAFFDQNPQHQGSRLWAYMLSAYLEFDTGGDIYSLSSLDFYDDEEYTGGDLLIANGYDKIADFLAEGIDVRLNTKIEGIDYSGERTEITTADQAFFDADYVLLTVPLGVLKQNVISFSPPLPQRIQDPINKLEMGQVNKFLCVWDTAFWDTDLQYIGYTPAQRGKFNYFMNVKKFSEVNALMTFAFGDYSESTEGMSDAEVIEEIMGHLKAIYGPDIPNPTGFRRTKWSTNAFTFGSYSFAAQGARSSDFEQFEEAVDDKLFFAGEHTNRDYRGTVHGAYDSGLREAEKIADLLC